VSAQLGRGILASPGKMRWHKHYSASARACSLYDPYTLFDAAPPTPSSSVASSSAAGLAQQLHQLQPPQQQSFDVPLPTPAYLSAFRDGESYLEARLQHEHSVLLQQQHKRAASAGVSKSRSAALMEEEDDEAAKEYSVNLATMLFLRGHSVCAADARPLMDPSLYSTASLSPLQVLRSTTPVLGVGRLACCWSNGQGVLRPLDGALRAVYKQLRAQAYTHHYRKYGVEIDDLWQAVASMEQLASDYRGLSFRHT